MKIKLCFILLLSGINVITYCQTRVHYTIIQQNRNYNIVELKYCDITDTTDFKSLYLIQFLYVDTSIFHYTNNMDTICNALNKLCQMYKDSNMNIPTFLQVELYAEHSEIHYQLAFYNTKSRIYEYDYYNKKGRFRTKKKKLKCVTIYNN